MSDNSLVPMADNSALAFVPTEENIELLKNTLQAQKTNLTNNELGLFLYQAQKTGLDPLARQIYVLKTGDRVSFMTSIDGQRLVAQRTGQYQGQVGPEWCGKDGIWKDVWLEDGNPAAARVGIYREGFEAPVYGVATWKSYAKPESATWKKLGDVMLAKCAEALALRKAFPQELANLYTSEEMDQANGGQQKMSLSDAILQAANMLEAMGVESSEDRKAIIVKLAGVKDVKELNGKRVKKVLDQLKDAKPADILKMVIKKDKLDAIDGELVDNSVDNGDNSEELEPDEVAVSDEDLADLRSSMDEANDDKPNKPSYGPRPDSGLPRPQQRKYYKDITADTSAKDLKEAAQAVIKKDAPATYDDYEAMINFVLTGELPGQQALVED